MFSKILILTSIVLVISLAVIRAQQSGEIPSTEITNSQEEYTKADRSRNIGTSFGLAGALAGIACVALVFYSQNKKIRRINTELQSAYADLKSTQQKLIKSEKMAAFGVVASRVAHEIQNPLNFVNNFSELSTELVNEIVTSADANHRKETSVLLIDNLNKIGHHGKRAENIVKQLQEHTRTGTAHEYFEDK